MLDQHRDYVLKTVTERGVRLVRLWFTDVLGNLKSFAISPAELENALSDGMTFDGSSIDGFSRVQEADVLAVPDPHTFEILPWGDPAGGAEARVFCDIHDLDGQPFAGDPRQVLRRHVQAAHAQGHAAYCNLALHAGLLHRLTAPHVLAPRHLLLLRQHRKHRPPSHRSRRAM